ncbi:hypothetical protein AVEN_235781-1 [Araneus ventricosus]|uniref:Uncharacterized protein n=1 Tax=Araneus ventricosus TaxID=182803 RepID=A0A4Y2HM19_ARAVE|nr:hypothetical protein AVEN_235781-1 [Araneus ventricosus]
MGQRGFDYGDITAVRKICVDIRQAMNKQQKQTCITDFFKAVNVKRKIPSVMLFSMQIWTRLMPMWNASAEEPIQFLEPFPLDGKVPRHSALKGARQRTTTQDKYTEEEREASWEKPGWLK